MVGAPEREPPPVSELTVLACPVSARERERAQVSAPKKQERVSAIEVGLECPHPRSAWAKPNHTGQGTDSETRPRAGKGPLTRVVASGRPSEGEGANSLNPIRGRSARRRGISCPPVPGTARTTEPKHNPTKQTPKPSQPDERHSRCAPSARATQPERRSTRH
jgi:hypothetical protein